MVYSITSSARASRVGGTSMPSALAVERLITNSNLLDWSRNKLAQQSQLLWSKFGKQEARTGHMAPRARQIGNEAHPDRVLSAEEHDWNDAVSALAATAAGIGTATITAT